MVPMLRAIRDALTDATNGVNAKLDAVVLDGSDTRPADVVTFWVESDDDYPALDVLPEDADLYPAIQVESGEFVFSDATVVTTTGDVSITLQLRYINRNPDPSQARLDAWYTFNAMAKSIRAYFRLADVDRVRAGWYPYHIERLRLVPAFQPEGDALVTGGLELTFTAREQSPF